MTRLPVDTWEIGPRLDLGRYDLNTVCPVTGSQGDLEDHHIWRRSFTALGSANEFLYWVELPVETSISGSTIVLPNRVALSTDAHERITTNRARLEFRGRDLWYVEGEEEMHLSLSFRLMAQGEKVSAPRKRAKKEPSRFKQVYSVRAPVDAGENGIEILEELVQACREKHAPALGWSESVPDYYVITAVLARDLSS